MPRLFIFDKDIYFMTQGVSTLAFLGDRLISFINLLSYVLVLMFFTIILVVVVKLTFNYLDKKMKIVLTASLLFMLLFDIGSSILLIGHLIG